MTQYPWTTAREDTWQPCTSLSWAIGKISMLRGPKISTTSQARYEGYLQALSEYGLTPEPRHVYAGTLNMESGHEFARKIIAGSENPPSAVFVGGDLTSFGVIDECMKLGISIPQDLSIVGFDDVPMS
ncbi:MAG: substrate-binding domain-containing protein [Enterocloster clostridioformis]